MIFIGGKLLGMAAYKKIERMLYNEQDEWIGVETTEVMSREEAARRYPHLVFIDNSPWPWLTAPAPPSSSTASTQKP